MTWVRKQTAEFDRRWQYLYRLTQGDLAEWLVAVKSYAKLIQNVITVSSIETAIDTGQSDTLYIDTLEADTSLLRKATERMSGILQRSATAEIARLKYDFSFTLENPFAYSWIRSHGAELVVQVTAETKSAIRTVITEAFQNGDPPRRAAIRIRNLVGLTQRDSVAALNRWRALASDGSITPKRADEMADSYAARLLRRRSDNIARTETINAAARGTQLSWQEAQARGVLLPGVMQEWIAAAESPRTCPICLQLDGQQVPVGQPFFSAVLNRAIAGPTAHPSCRCAVGLALAT